MADPYRTPAPRPDERRGAKYEPVPRAKGDIHPCWCLWHDVPWGERGATVVKARGVVYAVAGCPECYGHGVLRGV